MVRPMFDTFKTIKSSSHSIDVQQWHQCIRVLYYQSQGIVCHGYRGITSVFKIQGMLHRFYTNCISSITWFILLHTAYMNFMFALRICTYVIIKINEIDEFLSCNPNSGEFAFITCIIIIFYNKWNCKSISGVCFICRAL